MKNRIIKRILSLTTLLICIFGISFYFLNTGLKSTDDIVYKEAFNSFSTCVKWIGEFYNTWSGRITLTILINIFGKLPVVYFKLANVMMFIIIILSMYKIVTLLIENWSSKIRNQILIMLFGSIFLINMPVLNSGCLWIAGAFNYFWPLATMLVAIIPFISELKEKRIGIAYYIVAIVSNVLAGFAEQTSAILVVFGIICILICKINKRKISKILIIHFLIIVIFTLINFLAPGNFVRSHSEMIQWYPNYEMISLSDKIVQGYIRVLDHLINDTTILFVAIAILSSYLVMSNEKMSKASKNISIITIMAMIYVSLKLVLDKMLIHIFPRAIINVSINQTFFALITFKEFNETVLYSPKVLIELIFSSYIALIVAVQLIYSFSNKKSGLIVSILYCASICSSLIMSFSPTIYASGNRTFTSTDFLLVLINGLLWAQLLNSLKESEHKNWKSVIGVNVFFIIIIICSLFGYMNLYNNGINNIIY